MFEMALYAACVWLLINRSRHERRRTRYRIAKLDDEANRNESTRSHEVAWRYSPNAVYPIILVQVHRKLALIIMGRKQFIPLESNPEVMTDFMQNLGADTRQFKFTDVWGLDPVRFDGDRVRSIRS